MTDEMCAFTAPEMLQGRAISTKLAMEKVSFIQWCMPTLLFVALLSEIDAQAQTYYSQYTALQKFVNTPGKVWFWTISA